MKKPVSVYKLSFLNKCPSCAKGDIYESVLSVKDNCDVCGFALKEHDAGDGPAFFVMFIVGTIVTVSAVMLEFMYPLNKFVHMAIWTPLTIIMCIYLLRVMKSFLIASEYKHNVHGFADKRKK